jgi:ABC-type uncharacterized transport system fused permease/ATPase subunit
VGFALVGIPAAVVNAGLKWMQKAIELSFQQRLGLSLHRAYTRNRAYYAASTLGGLTHADQRMTEDVERFCASLSELYNHTVKPLLDVLLFTRSLSRVMGYKVGGGVTRTHARTHNTACAGGETRTRSCSMPAGQVRCCNEPETWAQQPCLGGSDPVVV